MAGGPRASSDDRGGGQVDQSASESDEVQRIFKVKRCILYCVSIKLNDIKCVTFY